MERSVPNPNPNPNPNPILPSSIPSVPGSGGLHHSYSRKDKSLGLLCTNFLRIYNHEGVKSVALEDATTQLGVERRRIYDIVNVLESIGILARKGKSEYIWLGFDGIPQALNALRIETLMESSGYDPVNLAKMAGLGQDELCVKPFLLQPCSSTSSDKGREKSLKHLTQSFVKLFLSMDSDIVTLDEAATILLGDASEMPNNSGARAKVRRLYDIANVLTSINLMEKTHHPTTRKPALRWLGFNRVSKNESVMDSSTKKRTFGTEITNTNYKRTKMVTSVNDKPNDKVAMLKGQTSCEHLTSCDGNKKMRQSNQLDESSKGVVFGPFGPVDVPKVDNNGKKNMMKLQDLENLASTYRPKYHNEVLNDLFAHYKEAWSTWFVDISEKQPTQLSPAH